MLAPGAKANGTSAAAPVQALDIYPTLCELCGIKPPTGIEGHTLIPLLTDAKAKWDHPAYSVAGNRKNLGVAVRMRQYRYAEWTGGKGEGAAFVRRHSFTWDGSFPLNTSGGQLSVGQAGAAGGSLGMVEALRQLTGQAAARQVQGAKLGLVSGFGMINFDRGLGSGAAILSC